VGERPLARVGWLSMPSGYSAGTGVRGPPSERGVDRLNRSLSSGSAISPKMRAVETPLVVRSDNEGWSLYGAQRLQPVATGGKCGMRRKRGSDNRKPLPWAATDCLRRYMVRRGSTVRVRQRALQKPRITGLFVSDRFADSLTWGRHGALYGAFRSKTPSKRAASLARGGPFDVPHRAVAVPSSEELLAARFAGPDGPCGIGEGAIGRKIRARRPA
jgi:hypothetical protein